MTESITVVLNVYKRLSLLNEQIDAIVNQSVIPSEIYIWNNSGSSIDFTSNEVVPITVFDSQKNLGVWARFAVALNSQKKYIAVFDDDTIPGQKWFENCLKNIGDGNYILGSRGLRFLSDKNYSPYESYGWDNPNKSLIEVDIIGHSWFFERKILSSFWGNYSDRYPNDYCGEDIHLSFSAQRSGYKSIIPPHDVNDIETWGSLPKYAIEYGTDSSAISSDHSSLVKFTSALKHYISKGFITYYMLNKNPAKLLIKTNFREKGISKFISKSPRLYKILKNLKKILNEKGIQF
jgi:hypothetical protein